VEKTKSKKNINPNPNSYNTTNYNNSRNSYNNAQQKQQERTIEQQKQIASNIKHELDYLTKEYNKIQRENPNDPRLGQIIQRVKYLRKQKK